MSDLDYYFLFFFFGSLALALAIRIGTNVFRRQRSEEEPAAMPSQQSNEAARVQAASSRPWDSYQIEPPKFLLGLDRWLLKLRFGETWKKYFIFRFSVLLCVLFYAAFIPGADSLLWKLVGLCFYAPWCFLWFFAQMQWGFGRRVLVPLQMAFLIMAVMVVWWTMFGRLMEWLTGGLITAQ